MLANEMMIFFYVAKLSSYSKAADILQVSKSHISKQVQGLEKKLNIRLFNRSTRKINLTHEGEIFFQYCQQLDEIVQKSFDAIHEIQTENSGTLKISIPPALGLHAIHKVIASFVKENPKIKLSITLENKIEDIIQQGYDLVLRSATLHDSNLVAQKIASFESVLCCSPIYFRDKEKIIDIEQLSQQKIAVYDNNSREYAINFMKNNKHYPIKINPSLYSNSMSFILNMVLEGCCIAAFPQFMTSTFIQEKKLMILLPEYKLPSSPLYAVYPEKTLIPKRVKHFITYLKNNLPN